MVRKAIHLGTLLAVCALAWAEGIAAPGIAPNKIEVSSVRALRAVMTRSHQKIVMAPGTYAVPDLIDSRTVFHLSGSDNVYDLSGVTLQIPLP
ncbi:MAG: hypothetical protein GY809_08900 [Planctomycetes bacterium]|nr:hypothetical protein [Planctomycetota bacterium]